MRRRSARSAFVSRQQNTVIGIHVRAQIIAAKITPASPSLRGIDASRMLPITAAGTSAAKSDMTVRFMRLGVHRTSDLQIRSQATTRNAPHRKLAIRNIVMSSIRRPIENLKNSAIVMYKAGIAIINTVERIRRTMVADMG